MYGNPILGLWNEVFTPSLLENRSYDYFTAFRVTLPALLIHIFLSHFSYSCADVTDYSLQLCRESVTMSVFILSGSQLKATYSLEGPFGDLDLDSGSEIYTKANEFARGGGGAKSSQLNFKQEVDFEHLMDEVDDDDDYVDDDDGTDDEYDDDAPIKPDDPDADKKRRERRDRQRKKFLAVKKKREEKKLNMMKRIRQDGEPILKTMKASGAGWYRMCVNANWNQVSKQIYSKEYPRVFFFFDTSGYVRPFAHAFSFVFRLLSKWK